jgi:hypothetical protein
MQQVLFEFSIYTIAHRDKLAKAASRSGATKFSEARAWKTGYDLWGKAKAAGAVMPVVFADAADCSRLLYWGVLTNIVIEDNTTQYSVKQMRKLKGRHSPQELLLKSGKAIAPKFIKPYAICRTPSFLAEAALTSRSTLGSTTMEEPASADQEWKRFTGDLAICLADLSEDEFLVLSSNLLHYYVHFAAQGKFGMRAEATSNTYLEPGKDELSTDAYAAMEQLGWKLPTEAPVDPDGSPNFFLDLSCPVDFASLATLAVKTLRHLYNIDHPGKLQYKSFRGGGGGRPDTQIRFPTLRIKRAE